MISIFRNTKNKKSQGSFGDLKSDTFNFDFIERYFYKKDHADSLQAISDKTCNDIDFQELFMFIDRTSSKVGQQFLYDLLRSIPKSTNPITENEALIQQFGTNLTYRESVQKHLKKLNREDAYYIPSLFQEEHLSAPSWFFVVRLLAFSSLLTLLLIYFTPSMVFILLGIFIINMGIHYWNKNNLNQYLNSIPQLLILSHTARELFKDTTLQKLNPNLEKSLKTIENVKRRMSFFQLEAKMQGDLEAVFWGILELFKILFLLEPLLLFGVLRRLDSKRTEIAEVFQFVGTIDTFISIASLRKGTVDFCIPDISSNNHSITGDDIYHPLIEHCVKNDIRTDGRSILLTGSNMSGKTSFIRTIAINSLTGQTINTCFAKRFSMPRMTIYSAIRISDDLLNDKSYYFAEVLSLKEMLDVSENGQTNLFLLDEIFKGTNTIERIAAGKAVLSHLTKHNNLVFVSTHDIELADLLKDEYNLFHFSEKVENKSVDFDYKIKSGKLKTRNAIKILELNQYPETIIKEASQLANELLPSTHSPKY